LDNGSIQYLVIFGLVEEKGQIEVSFKGMVNGKALTPLDVDITEVREVITDIENFLYPTRGEKTERPLIAYKIETGSAKHLFFLPITSVIIFNSLIGEVAHRKTVDFLDFRRADILEKFQRKARERDLEITMSTSLADKKTLVIDRNTNYYNVSPDWINTDFTLYGEVYQEGGINPNFHIINKEYGKLTIAATKEQILEGEKRVYKIYGIKASGKMNIATGKPFDLKLENFIEYNPIFDQSELDLLIAKATPNLSKIENVDEWLEHIRGGGGNE
jgi:hypothetical protein